MAQVTYVDGGASPQTGSNTTYTVTVPAATSGQSQGIKIGVNSGSTPTITPTQGANSFFPPTQSSAVRANPNLPNRSWDYVRQGPADAQTVTITFPSACVAKCKGYGTTGVLLDSKRNDTTEALETETIPATPTAQSGADGLCVTSIVSASQHRAFIQPSGYTKPYNVRSYATLPNGVIGGVAVALAHKAETGSTAAPGAWGANDPDYPSQDINAVGPNIYDAWAITTLTFVPAVSSTDATIVGAYQAVFLGAPESGAVDSITQTSATFRFTPKDASADSLQVFLATGTGALALYSTVAATATSAPIAGLTQGTAYRVAVRAIRGAVISASEEVSFTTQGAITPPAPSDVAVSNVTARGAFASWSLNSQNQSFLEVYVGPAGNLSLYGTLPANATNIQLTNLTPQTLYVIQVRVVAGDLYSPFSIATSFTTAADPIDPPAPPPAPPPGSPPSAVTKRIERNRKLMEHD